MSVVSQGAAHVAFTGMALLKDQTYGFPYSRTSCKENSAMGYPLKLRSSVMKGKAGRLDAEGASQALPKSR